MLAAECEGGVCDWVKSVRYTLCIVSPSPRSGERFLATRWNFWLTVGTSVCPGVLGEFWTMFPSVRMLGLQCCSYGAEGCQPWLGWLCLPGWAQFRVNAIFPWPAFLAAPDDLGADGVFLLCLSVGLQSVLTCWENCNNHVCECCSSSWIVFSAGAVTGALESVSAMYSCFPGTCSITYSYHARQGRNLSMLGGRQSRFFDHRRETNGLIVIGLECDLFPQDVV